jgi:glycosyltransferase involved in cell wall biosynthesis
MRYIWDLYDDYFARDRAGVLTRTGMKLTVGYLRRWDRRTAQNPHHIIAISECVRQRVKATYGRHAEVIYPPVETARFAAASAGGDYFLVVSALVPYKRIDLAIDAFNRTGKRLVVVGTGPERARLQARASRNIEFLGWQSDDALVALYSGCRAVVFPGKEDFGIVPVEAMASGKPVIAFARGGALETVIDTPLLKTGILFSDQTPESLLDALQRFDHAEFDPHALHAFSLTFDRKYYKQRMSEFIMDRWSSFKAQFPQPLKRE